MVVGGDGTRRRFYDDPILRLLVHQALLRLVETWVPVEMTTVGFAVDNDGRRSQVGVVQVLCSHGEPSASRGDGHDLVLQAVRHLRGKPVQRRTKLMVDGIELKVGCGAAAGRWYRPATHVLCEVSELAEDGDEAGHGKPLQEYGLRRGGPLLLIASWVQIRQSRHC